jgi:uncharacterized RDD family membrane protein YckC
MAEKSYLPDPNTAPELFEGVLSRRVLAWLIDLVILTVIVSVVAVIGFIFGILTLGLGWLALPIIVPLALVFYYAVTLGSNRRATIGMSMTDLVLTPTKGPPLDGWTAFIHPLLFWLTIWFLAPVSLVVALVTPRRQMLHDLVLGVLMLRRSPMEKRWKSRAAT